MAGNWPRNTPDMSPQHRLSLSKDEFAQESSKGSIPPLFVKIPYIEPHIAYEGLRGPGTLLLESVKGPMNIARYSFVCVEPFCEYRIKDGKETLRHEGRDLDETTGKPLKTLRNMLQKYSQSPVPGLPPFLGGGGRPVQL
ncbi:hypothetical protein ACFL4R_00385 [Nitrospirota bacterium]